MMPAELPPPSRAATRRQHLLDTARALFIEHGFHQTGVAQIAAASGIKVGQIYRDFHSKEDVIAAICERDIFAWLEEDRLAAAIAAGDKAFIRQWIDRFLLSEEPPEECRLMSEIVAEIGRNPRISQLNRSIDTRMQSSLTAALDALAPGSDSEERATLIDFIHAFGIGLVMRRVLDPDLKVVPLFRYASAFIDQRLAALTH